MLSVVRIAPGDGIRYLIDQVATGRHDFRKTPENAAVAYMADATAHGEAPGWWAGQTRELFGISGIVDPEHLHRLIGKGQHPVTEEQLGRMWRIYQPMTDEYRAAAYEKALAKLPADATVEQKAKLWNDIHLMPERKAVAGFDVTVSMVKSGSLLFAFGDDRVKSAVMAAQHAGVRAVIEHLRAHGAFTRTGVNGVVQIDTDGLAVAVFDHRMSRAGDPQIHSHIVISSKVRTTDGKWLALDSKAFYQATIGARIAYDRAVEHELHQRLGARFAAREGSPIREIVGITMASIRHYSKRRTAIEANVAGAKPAGMRVPDSRWRRVAQIATLRTRAPRDLPESTREMEQRLRREDAAAGLSTAADVRRVVAGRVSDDVHDLAVRALSVARRVATDPVRLTETDVDAALQRLGVHDDRRPAVINAAVRLDEHLAVERAVANLAEERAVFRLDHVELHVGRVLGLAPDCDRRVDWRRVQRLAAEAVRTHAGGLRVLTPPELVDWDPTLIRPSDGQGVYTRHRDLHLSTRTVLGAENEVIAYAARTGAAPASAELLDDVAAELDLSPDKVAALHHVIGDDRRVTGVIGPAGSGKTFMQKAVAVAAARAGIPVLGLAVGQHAADVLADATRTPDGTVMRTENVAMWLHSQHTPPAGTSTEEHWSFKPGQWLILDEASQASSLQLAELVRLLDKVGGKLILVGDPEQVSAVGPGGLLRYLAGLGLTAELADLRRFTNPWEGPASLRLREGDITILVEYERRGRIIAGAHDDLIPQMLPGWAGDTLNGLDSLLLVETQAEAADLAAQARTLLIQAGIVERGRTVALADDNRASVGDRIVTRRNDRRLETETGFVANRDTWRITAISPRGEVEAVNTRTDDAVVLPAEYVAVHVQLAYASTVDAAQGRTVDTARSLIDEATTRGRLYVMATRGALTNLLYVITHHRPEEAHHRQTPGAGVATLAEILTTDTTDTTDRSATETEQRLAADHDSLKAWGPIFDDLIGRTDVAEHAATIAKVAGRHHPDPSSAAAARTATTASRIAARLVNDPALPALTYRLSQLTAAGYDPGQVLDAAVAWRELDTAQDIAAVLTWRVEMMYATALADPRAATRPDQTLTYTDRVPATATGGLRDALEQVAGVADRRIAGLAELAAALQPTWTAALGPVPDDEHGRAQWIGRAAVVVAYRDRHTVPRDEAIGPEPSHRDAARWAAWHRARIALGVATVAGQVAAAPDHELREWVALQRAADRTAPAYVGDELRAAHLQLAAAEHRVDDLRQRLAAAESVAERLRTTAPARAPRWRRASTIDAQTATRTANQQRADDRVDRLTARLDDADRVVADRQTAVDRLEDRHTTWTTNYEHTLPMRYLGLAATAEQARRAHAADRRSDELRAAVKAVTAKVHAVDDTRPKPHTEPVDTRLPLYADAGRERTDEAIGDVDADIANVEL
ncbi:MobF family relaxase [Dactylosporangium sp. NPDC051485]|uniref:MobF family relaxase n=1 Tax=Dactylosporangium sp. NPDC051485 TaxID=3154846 RepID=UPI00344A2382